MLPNLMLNRIPISSIMTWSPHRPCDAATIAWVAMKVCQSGAKSACNNADFDAN